MIDFKVLLQKRVLVTASNRQLKGRAGGGRSWGDLGHLLTTPGSVLVKALEHSLEFPITAKPKRGS